MEKEVKKVLEDLKSRPHYGAKVLYDGNDVGGEIEYYDGGKTFKIRNLSPELPREFQIIKGKEIEVEGKIIDIHDEEEFANYLLLNPYYILPHMRIKRMVEVEGAIEIQSSYE